MQYCHNSDFGRFELSIQVDCTFDDNFFGKNVTFVYVYIISDNYFS